MIETKVNGLAELDKALATLADKLQRNVVRGALRAGAKQIEVEAKAQLARNQSVHTGALRDSVRVSVRLVRGVPKATISAGSKKAWYAKLVEFGTTKHIIQAKQSKGLFFGGINRAQVNHPGATKRPYMRPALDAASAKAIEAYAAYIRKRLAKQGLDVPAPADDA